MHKLVSRGSFGVTPDPLSTHDVVRTITHMSTTTIPRFERRHRLALALDHADVPVGEMATVLGVSRNTVGNYLSGRTKPPTSAVKLWAMRCGVPYEWIEHGVIELDPDTPDGLGSRHSGCYADVVPFPVGRSDQQTHAA